MSHVKTNNVIFGFATAFDLYKKLKYDSELLLKHHPETEEGQWQEECEAYNFFVTAWHLHKDWLGNSAITKPSSAATKISGSYTYMKEIRRAMREIANGSKHFLLNDAPRTNVGEREISSYYSYFFGPQYSIDTDSFHFLMYEFVGLVMDYFEWIFDDSSSTLIPTSILEKMEKAKELRAARKQY